MKAVFFGTPKFASEHLEYLLENQINVVAVVTRADRPKGRSGTPVSPPVKVVANEHNIPVHQPERASDPEFIKTLKTLNADLYIVVAYGKILIQTLIDLPPKGCINVHASLLPKYRGAAPIQQVIIDGEKESGVTIMHLAKEMDAGDIIKPAVVSINQNMTFGELEQHLCNVGKQTLIEVIRDIERGSATRTPQDHSKATYAGKIELEDCEIDWNQSAQTIHNLVRGVNPYPGAWCFVQVRDQKKRLKLLSTEVVSTNQGKPGEILVYGKNEFIVGCGNQSIRIQRLQLEGKKAMQADELMKGIPKANISLRMGNNSK